MRRITLKNGEEHAVTFCGAADGYLWLQIADMESLSAAVTAFDRPEATETIAHDWDGNDRVIYEGYTVLDRVARMEDGIQVVLMQEHGA